MPLSFEPQKQLQEVERLRSIVAELLHVVEAAACADCQPQACRRLHWAALRGGGHHPELLRVVELLAGGHQPKQLQPFEPLPQVHLARP